MLQTGPELEFYFRIRPLYKMGTRIYMYVQVPSKWIWIFYVSGQSYRVAPQISDIMGADQMHTMAANLTRWSSSDNGSCAGLYSLVEEGKDRKRSR